MWITYFTLLTILYSMAVLRRTSLLQVLLLMLFIFSLVAKFFIIPIFKAWPHLIFSRFLSTCSSPVIHKEGRL
jgi:hypothetical protein